MKRPAWDEYFLNIAKIVATRSTCLRAHHGAVIVDKYRRILGTGYNEAPAGMKGCAEVGCQIVNRPDYGPSCVRAPHAEINALFYLNSLNNHGLATTIYITGTPCLICLEYILKFGIKRIVCAGKYNDQPSAFREALLNAWGATITYLEI